MGALSLLPADAPAPDVVRRPALYERWVYILKSDLTQQQQSYLRKTLTIERVRKVQRGDPPATPR